MQLPPRTSTRGVRAQRRGDDGARQPPIPVLEDDVWDEELDAEDVAETEDVVETEDVADEDVW